MDEATENPAPAAEPGEAGASAEDETEGLSFRIMKQAKASDLIERMLNPKAETKQLEPWPISARVLSSMIELSNSLRPNIDSYRVNVHGKGHRFVPSIRLDTPGAEDRVKDALFLKVLLEAAEVGDDTALAEVSEPSPADVEARIASLKREMLVERARLQAFFDHAYPEGSFTDLRMLSSLDLECTGNFFWEVLRDAKTQAPITVYWVRAHTMQIAKPDQTRVAVQQRRRMTPIDFEKIPIERTFHRFAQTDATGATVRWFKQFGDPRLMSAQSGMYYKDLRTMQDNEKHALLATEIFHYRLPSLVSVYGMPRWAGNLPAVLGSRELDEVNFDLFASNAVPALAVLVSGGHMSGATYERLKEFFENEVRGKKSMHKVVVLEAESQKKTGQQQPTANPKIDLVPLRSAQLKDALFQEYDSRNRKKVRGDFRLPASILGEETFNLEDLRFADEQVYDPERDTFDSAINHHFLPELGIRYWVFESVGSVLRNSDAVARALLDAISRGVYTPDEGREFLSRVLNIDAGRTHAKWANIPLPVLLAIIGMKAGPAEAVREQGRQGGDPSPQAELFAELGLENVIPKAPAKPAETDEDEEEEEEVVAKQGVSAALPATPPLNEQHRDEPPES